MDGSLAGQAEPLAFTTAAGTSSDKQGQTNLASICGVNPLPSLHYHLVAFLPWVEGAASASSPG